MANTILIVDDSTSMRRLVSYTLTDAGYDVVDAVDGADAIDKLKGGGKVDAIVSDLNMPNMDGIEFLKQVRSIPLCKFTPVIMLTTESQQSKVIRAGALGISGWLLKPFAPEKLIEAIKKVVK